MALMRFYYHVDPYELTPDQLCKLRGELEWLQKLEIIPIKIERG